MNAVRSALASSLWAVFVLVGAGLRGAEEIVSLPPLEVTASIKDARPWQYTAHGGVEILSRCSTSTTKDFARAHCRIEQVFAFLVPPEFQVKFSVPKIIVLADQQSTSSASQELVQGPVREAGAPRSAAERADREAVRFLPNLRLHDFDAVAVYAMLDESRFDSEHLGLTRDHIRMMLERRTPPLPAWLIEGVMGVCTNLNFERDWLIFQPADWIDGEEENLRQDAEFPRTLLPMRELLEDARPGATASSGAAQRWQAQAALFVRWALDGTEPRRRAAFWRYAARACDGPVDEAVFRECFGLSYADVRDRLSDYLPKAIQTTVRVDPDKLPPIPEPKVRLATDAEVGRIKGDWERLEVIYVKLLYPRYVARYEEQADRTLTKAYAADSRDDGLNAIRALRACDAGRNAEARPLLEAAVQAKVVRPRVYYELARVRLAEAMAKPEGPGGYLSSDQANKVLQPLTSAYGQSPPLVQVFDLAAEVWSRSEAQLSPKQFELLEEGLRRFPWHVGLIYHVAIVRILHRQDAEALTLVERGLQLNPTTNARAGFEKLRALIASRAGARREQP